MEFFRLFFLCFLLIGCTVGPDYHPPQNKLPTEYSAPKSDFSSKNQHQFWSLTIGDKTLTRLIHQALLGANFDIQKSYASILQARATLGIAKADFFPQLNAEGKISRDKLSGNTELIVAFPPGSVPLNYTDYKFGFDASWELDFFGRIRRNVEASKARFQNMVENQQNVAISVAAEVASIYTQYRIYQQRIIIAKKTITSFTETVHLVKLRMQAGSASKVDLNRVESEVLSSKAIVPPLRAEGRASLAALAVLVGELPESLFKELDKTAPIPKIKPKRLSVGLPSDLLRRRPDIRMAERTLAAATADIGVAVANQYPQFQLIGDLGSETTILGTFFQAASSYWSIGPHVNIPIFQGGRLKDAVAAQVQVRDIALANYKQTILQALGDVESSLIRYNKERIRSQKINASYDKLGSVLNLVKLQYREGKASLTDVLDVERQLEQLEDQRVQSEGQVTIDLISLYKSLGGSW